MARSAPAAKSRRKDENPVALVSLGKPSLRNRTRTIDEERRARLKGQRRYKRLREMAEVDSTIGGFIRALTLYIGKVEWSAKAPEGVPPECAEVAEELAARVQGAWEDMEQTPSEIIHEMVYHAVRDGAAPMERTYKICRGPEETDPVFKSDFDDGMVAWRAWSIRPLESVYDWCWNCDRTRVEAVVQQTDEDNRLVEIPWSKILNLRFNSLKNSPEGESMIAIAEREQFRKMHFEDVEAIGIKRELCGIPIARVPAAMMSPSATAEQRAALEEIKRIVQHLDQDELSSLVWPHAKNPDGTESGWDISVMTSGGSRAINVSEVIRRIRSDIAVCLGGAFLYAGVDGVGAKSLDESKQDVFRLVVLSLLRCIKQLLDVATVHMMTMQPVPPPRDVWPVFEHGPLEPMTLAEFSSSWAQMSQAGATIDDAIENKARELAGVGPLSAARARSDAAIEVEAETKADNEEDDAADLDAATIDRLVGEPEIRRLLNMGRVGVRKLVREGKLSAYQIGGRWKYDPSDVQDLIAAHAVVPG